MRPRTSLGIVLRTSSNRINTAKLILRTIQPDCQRAVRWTTIEGDPREIYPSVRGQNVNWSDTDLISIILNPSPPPQNRSIRTTRLVSSTRFEFLQSKSDSANGCRRNSHDGSNVASIQTFSESCGNNSAGSWVHCCTRQVFCPVSTRKINRRGS